MTNFSTSSWAHHQVITRLEEAKRGVEPVQRSAWPGGVREFDELCETYGNPSAHRRTITEAISRFKVEAAKLEKLIGEAITREEDE